MSLDVSPIIDNYGYIMYAQNTEKTKSAAQDFQQILIEEMYAPAFIPDPMLVDEEENEEDKSIFNIYESQNKLYTEMTRQTIASQLVAQDALNLNPIINRYLSEAARN